MITIVHIACDLSSLSNPFLEINLFLSVYICLHLLVFLFFVSPLLALQKREGRQRTKKGNLKV